MKSPSTKRIVVIGSVNMDLVCRTPRMPREGETIIGEDLLMIPGGKGANQAVAAARLAGPRTQVHFVARVGDDDFGRRLRDGLLENHVGTDYVTITRGVPSGCALILVDERGENMIVVAPGANAILKPADVDRAKPVIEGAAAVVLQLEVPLATVRHAIATCRRLRVPTILDPAPVPVRGLPRDLFAVDMLTPNEGEAERLLDSNRKGRRSVRKWSGSQQVARELLACGAASIVLKLGSRGSLLADRNGREKRGRAFKVKVVDSTAAGDAFTAALAVARAEGHDEARALRFANAAGALCCTRLGAQPSLPMRKAVERLLRLGRAPASLTPRAGGSS